jgi:hypothetical protein
MVKIPEYIPLSRDMLGDLQRIKDHSIPPEELKDTSDKLLTSALEFIDQILETPANSNAYDEKSLSLLEGIVESFDSLARSQQESRVFSNTLNETRRMITEKMNTEPELSLENLDHFERVDLDRNLFSRVLKKELHEKEERLNDQSDHNEDPDYQYLKSAAFIVNHPLDPLPEENDNDDELQVEGGKIVLRCPLSLKIFENPMKSTRCGHTFDEEGIRGTWRHQAEPCPVPGCGKNLRLTDFEKDRLMNLRVKSYYGLQKKLENDAHVEKL